MSFTRRVEFYLFAVVFIAFAWFNQGGGWNQNARFAEVRSIVDGHELSIDNFFCYQHDTAGILRRYPVVNGDVTIGLKTTRLCWVGDRGDLFAVNGVEPPRDMEGVAIDDLASSGDVSFARSHFHPNKPPGLSFVAIPAYFVISHIEQLLHRNLDDWWILTLNAWLTSVFSVGVISAAGVVIAFRIAMRLSAGRLWPSLCAALAFAFGTLYFPFATLLFDHDVTAVLLLASFAFLFLKNTPAHTLLAGFLAGLAAITNYIAAVPVAFLVLYLLVTRRRSGPVAASLPYYIKQLLPFALGVLPAFVAILFYNQACYGSPFALSNAFQNPTFIQKGPVFLGMFGIPDPFIALILLVSPFRGIFYAAPILGMGVYGLVKMRRTFPAEFALFIAIFAIFFLVNSSFNGWHAGFSCGSRYLIPATTFLVIPSVFGFIHLPRLSGGLLLFSIAINFLFTATDAESPAGVGSLAMARDRQMFLYSPLTEYAVPLFFQHHAWPILNMLIRERLDDESAALAASGATTPEAQKPTLTALEYSLRKSIRSGKDDPLELGGYTGPVSVNPTSVCEGGYFRLFDCRSPEAHWNSFNIGEFWFPESRWSVFVLFAILSLFAVALSMDATREEARASALTTFGNSLSPDEIPAE